VRVAGIDVRKPRQLGGWNWRVTLPGHGEARCGKIFSILRDTDYRGAVSIELEDENINGAEEREKSSLRKSREFLSSI
jgi:sugar phosphate isomerase/epimerase